MIEAVSSVNSGAVPLISRDEFAHLGDGYILTNKTDPDPGDPSLPRRNRTRGVPHDTWRSWTAPLVSKSSLQSAIAQVRLWIQFLRPADTSA